MSIHFIDAGTGSLYFYGNRANFKTQQLILILKNIFQPTFFHGYIYWRRRK